MDGRKRGRGGGKSREVEAESLGPAHADQGASAEARTRVHEPHQRQPSLVLSHCVHAHALILMHTRPSLQHGVAQGQCHERTLPPVSLIATTAPSNSPPGTRGPARHGSTSAGRRQRQRHTLLSVSLMTAPVP